MATKAVEAAKAEATEELRDVSFTFDGVEYNVKGESFDDVEFLEAVEDEKPVRMLRIALGDQQWATFKSKRRTSADINGLADALFREYNASEPGESRG